MNTEQTVWRNTDKELLRLLQRINAKNIKHETGTDSASNTSYLHVSAVLPDGWTKDLIDKSLSNILSSK